MFMGLAGENRPGAAGEAEPGCSGCRSCRDREEGADRVQVSKMPSRSSIWKGWGESMGLGEGCVGKILSLLLSLF